MPWHTEISSIRMSAFYLIFIILPITWEQNNYVQVAFGTLITS